MQALNLKPTPFALRSTSIVIIASEKDMEDSVLVEEFISQLKALIKKLNVILVDNVERLFPFTPSKNKQIITILKLSDFNLSHLKKCYIYLRAHGYNDRIVLLSHIKNMKLIRESLIFGYDDYLLTTSNKTELIAKLKVLLALPQHYRAPVYNKYQVQVIQHELNQPLTAINSYLLSIKILLEKKRYSDLISLFTKLYKKIELQLTRVLKIVQVNNFFTYDNPRSLNLELAEINSVIKDTIELMDTDIKHYKVLIELKLDSELPNVSIDICKIQQVLINIITNALQAYELEISNNHLAKIIITSSLNEKKIRICVYDQAITLKKENISMLFTNFMTTKPQGKGVGFQYM